MIKFAFESESLVSRSEWANLKLRVTLDEFPSLSSLELSVNEVKSNSKVGLKAKNETFKKFIKPKLQEKKEIKDKVAIYYKDKRLKSTFRQFYII